MADHKPQSFDDVLDRLGEFFKALSFQQRLLLAGGVVLVGGTLWVFVVLLGQPKYVTLYSGLRPEDAQALGARLAAKNIPHQISPDGGSLLVPEDKLDASRLETAAAGLPRSARMGFELFDTPNWAGSDFTEKVNYQRALEGELERTLATLSEVEAVRVHLVMPRGIAVHRAGARGQSGGNFKDPRRPACRSRRSWRFRNWWPARSTGLRPENVTVVDADSNTPLLHGRDGAGGQRLTPRMRNWPRRWFIPWNRWWEWIMCGPACTWSMTLGTSEETQEDLRSEDSHGSDPGAFGRDVDG